tara:strand:- start:41 stop:265 length:225 start_codon:yes stop_codon:yes gene_type:complete
MPGGESVPQIMPAEIEDPGTSQRIAPGLGIDLHDGLTLLGKDMGRMIALAFLLHVNRRLLGRNRMRPAILVFGS